VIDTPAADARIAADLVGSLVDAAAARLCAERGDLGEG